MKKTQLYWTLTILTGALAVAIGAFGAHGLKPHLNADQWANFQTASDYHFYHVLAGALALLIHEHRPGRFTHLAPPLLLTGLLLFSGSIYLLACRDLLPFSVNWLGPITPIGGLLLILAWAFMLPGKRNQDGYSGGL
jgi:uncharacterized membrane protein YgdD (TMEM256/DUF423 family)